jgi:hypothetical protein
MLYYQLKSGRFKDLISSLALFGNSFLVAQPFRLHTFVVSILASGGAPFYLSFVFVERLWCFNLAF